MIFAIQHPSHEYHWCSKLVIVLFQCSSNNCQLAILKNLCQTESHAHEKTHSMQTNLSQHSKFIIATQPINAREV